MRGEVAAALEEAMTAVCEELARKMVADGEGAEHLVELHVSGLVSDRPQRVSPGPSPVALVKTAFYGKDPTGAGSWPPRGRAGVRFDPSGRRILVGGIAIVEGGYSRRRRRGQAHRS